MAPSNSTPDHAPKRYRRWLRWVFGIFLLVWASDTAISLLIRNTRLRIILDERLETAFGRPVEVGRYSFSLWGGPSLRADSISVAEDPRFGFEYFLRAESLRIRLSWQGLLRGRLELGTVSLTRPSLNLVRAADGDWNIEAWLPRPAGGAAKAGAVPAGLGVTQRLRRIEVDSGRVNFKRGTIKLPFAFESVNGFLEQDSPGSWRADLETQPARAAAIVQQAGILRVQGHLGGTSSRLRPANLELTWHQASLSDVMRLTRGYDYGVRGDLDMVILARTEGPPWDLRGRVELRRIHRWDVPGRTDNPSLNLQAAGEWWPEQSRIELAQAVLETLRSNVHASGILDWSGSPVKAGDSSATLVQVLSSGIQSADLLSWIRAFHQGVAEEVAVRGGVGMDVRLTGWPPRIERGAVASDGLELTDDRLPGKASLGRTVIECTQDRWHLGPAILSIGSSQGALRLEASAEKRPDWKTTFQVSGQLANVKDVFNIAGILGWSLPAGWRLSGPAKLDLGWQGAPVPALAQPLGIIEVNTFSLLTPFLNSPVSQMKGRIELKPGEGRIALASAQAFGAHWDGTLESGGRMDEWRFALKADHLRAADLDRWLNPQRREGLLERIFPFLSSSSTPVPVPAWLRARGQLEIEQFTVAPLELHRLRADSAIDGRRIELSNASADFYGGKIEGGLRAELSSAPAYNVQAKFTRVNLGTLAATNASLEDKFSGTASGEASFEAKGTGRNELVQSLQCRGEGEARKVEVRGLDLDASLRGAIPRSGTSGFGRVEAAFTCAAGEIQFSNLYLSGSDAEYEASGSIDFSRNLDWSVRVLPAALGSKDGRFVDASDQEFRLTGPLFSPIITRIEKASVRR